MAREHPEEFAAYIGSRQSAEIQREIRKQEKELAAMRKRKMELDTIFKKLYEDSVLGASPRSSSGCFPADIRRSKIKSPQVSRRKKLTSNACGKR